MVIEHAVDPGELFFEDGCLEDTLVQGNDEGSLLLIGHGLLKLELLALEVWHLLKFLPYLGFDDVSELL